MASNKISTAVRLLVSDFSRKGVELSVTDGEIEASHPELLDKADRRRIDANRDELIAHLNTIKSDIALAAKRKAEAAKVANLTPKYPDLIVIVELGNGLVARAYGDGQPRAQPRTQSPMAHEAAKKMRSKAVASGPSAA